MRILKISGMLRLAEKEKCIDEVMSGKCTLSATTQQAIKERKAKRGKAVRIQKLKARRDR